LLQPSALFLKLLELANLVDFQPNIPLLPTMKGVFGNARPPDQFSKRNSCFRLLQDRNDLFEVESLLVHGKSPISGLDFAEN